MTKQFLKLFDDAQAIKIVKAITPGSSKLMIIGDNAPMSIIELVGGDNADAGRVRKSKS